MITIDVHYTVEDYMNAAMLLHKLNHQKNFWKHSIVTFCL